MSLARTCKLVATKRGALLSAAFVLLVPFIGCTSIREHIAMKDAAKAYRKGEYIDAANLWKKALAYNPNRQENWKHVGYCYWSKIDPGAATPESRVLTDNALEAFQKYLDMGTCDDSEKIQDYIINLYINQGRISDGIRYYENMLKSNPSDGRVLQALAVLNARAGNFEKTLEYSSKKAHLKEDDATGFLYVGALCWERSNRKIDPITYRQQMVDRGMEAIDKALRIDPSSFEGYTYKNLLYRQYQDFNKLQAEDEKDRRKKKEFEKKADDYLKLATEMRDKALAIRKAKQAAKAAADAAAASAQ